jgi:hypothetical protein
MGGPGGEGVRDGCGERSRRFRGGGLWAGVVSGLNAAKGWPPEGGRYGGGCEWREVAKHLRRARHAVPLRNPWWIGDASPSILAGRSMLRPYETVCEWREVAKNLRRA